VFDVGGIGYFKSGGPIRVAPFNTRRDVGLIELLLIVLVIAAIAGGAAVNPLLFVLLLVALVVLLTRGGFGYSRGGRV
jgi:hypothetical protein